MLLSKGKHVTVPHCIMCTKAGKTCLVAIIHKVTIEYTAERIVFFFAG